MTNEIVSSKTISFGENRIRTVLFEDGNVMLTIEEPTLGMSCNIHGEHKDLVELRNAHSEVLANGT